MLQRDQRLHTDTDKDAYYAQYATVQPAMDNHDPDEAKANGEVESSLGNDEVAEIYQILAPSTFGSALNHLIVQQNYLLLKWVADHVLRQVKLWP
jgi:hypothetical protein